ncbi:MAG: response regulator transcription factor [Chloroflexaceae bacterium]|jgi:DNA-binding response OmpR family regulator|nr:response regulator transcription factor [Chloroflexaceae bacterium]
MNNDAVILVADDQPDLLEMIEMTLETAGYHVLRALNGVEALNLLATHAVDLILADVSMPQMNGYQLYERVREHSEWIFIPFIFLSARTLDSDIRYGKELGADDYLTKPIEPEDLLAAVRGKLRRSRQMIVSAARSAGASKASITVGRLKIDPDLHKAWLDGELLKLSAREFTLLEHLARQTERVTSSHELVRATHGIDTDDVEAGVLLRPLIRSLRRKLGYDVGEIGGVENVRGVGYRLNLPES